MLFQSRHKYISRCIQVVVITVLKLFFFKYSNIISIYVKLLKENHIIFFTVCVFKKLFCPPTMKIFQVFAIAKKAFSHFTGRNFVPVRIGVATC